MQIYNILGIATLEVNTGTKTCACIFLPTKTMSKNSKSYCTVDYETGTIDNVSEASELKFSVVLETNWTIYRQKALSNYNKLFNTYVDQYKLLHILLAWVRELPKHIDAIKLFYGGDISNIYVIDVVNKVAHEYKDKLFYIQTCNYELVNKAYKHIKYPAKNLIIGLEICHTKHKVNINTNVNHVFIHYEHNESATYEDDLHFIPYNLNEKHVIINNPNICLLTKKYKKPIFDVLMDPNLPRHEFEKLCM